MYSNATYFLIKVNIALKTMKEWFAIFICNLERSVLSVFYIEPEIKCQYNEIYCLCNNGLGKKFVCFLSSDLLSYWTCSSLCETYKCSCFSWPRPKLWLGVDLLVGLPLRIGQLPSILVWSDSNSYRQVFRLSIVMYIFWVNFFN
jgi:hypothetical protein